MKHTPTPPTLVLMGLGDYTDFEGKSQVIMSAPLSDDGCCRVAVVHVHDDESAATAKKLVCSYNLHDELVDIVTAVLRNHEDGIAGYEDGWSLRLRAALKVARGEATNA